MLIIDKGRKIAEGLAGELLDPARTVVELDSADPDFTAAAVGRLKWQSFLRGRNGQQFIFEMDKSLIPVFTHDLVQEGVQVLAIRPRHSLEDYFLSLTTANQHVEAFTN